MTDGNLDLFPIAVADIASVSPTSVELRRFGDCCTAMPMGGALREVHRQGRTSLWLYKQLIFNTDECQACTQLAPGMHNAKVPHDDRCRDRIGELMAEDDDQRQVERVSGTVHPEVEIPRPEAGEEMDVGEPTVVEDQQPTSSHSSSGWIFEFRNPSSIRFKSK